MFKWTPAVFEQHLMEDFLLTEVCVCVCVYTQQTVTKL